MHIIVYSGACEGEYGEEVIGAEFIGRDEAVSATEKTRYSQLRWC
jgi:hypothetical protein